VNKRPLLILSFLLSFFILKAQDQDYVRSPSETTGESQFKKFSLGISFGPAIPLQDYASTNIKGSMWDFGSPDSTTLRGFAQTGFHFNITLSYLVTENFGVIFFYGGSSNPFDIGAFSSGMGYPTTNTSGAYYTAEYMVGPFFNLALSDKINFKITAMLGLVTNTYPILSVNLSDTVSVQRTVSGGAGIGYSFSAALSYNITDNIDILLNIGYTGCAINYAGWSETDIVSFPTLGQTGTATLDHPTAICVMQTGIIKPTLGIEFKF